MLRKYEDASGCSVACRLPTDANPLSPLSPPPDRHTAHIRERLQDALAGRYAVEAQIGKGGMGMVYRAHDLRHGREVAIKVLPPDLATAIAAERFLLEIRTAARLLHPHILGLIDSGDADGLLYYIMPCVEGESLREKLDRERTLPLAEALRITREVSSALAHAHAHGVVHRDIKPENVLLVDGVHAVVADFGLALALLRAADRKLTQSRHVVGTIAYMSPEQAGSGDVVDGRADIYSLGCILFEMLAGRPPFEGDSELAVLAQQMTAPPPRLPPERTDVPAAVERVVHRALEKDPAARYQTATQLCQELDEIPTAARPRRRLDLRGWPGVRRSGIVAAATLAGAAALGALAYFLPAAAPWRQQLSTAWSAPLDSSRYLVLPIRWGAGVPADVGAETRLQEAFARWNGIAVVDQRRLADGLAGDDAPYLETPQLQRLARRFGAGRFVQGDVTALGDSVRIAAAVYDAGSGRLLDEDAVKVRRMEAADPAAYYRLADRLLFSRVPSTARDEGGGATASAPAKHAYLRGHRAIAGWNLPAADSAFAGAIAHDEGFAAAQLWLAQVRAWESVEPRQWRSLVEQALARESQLSERERGLARALLHLSRDEYPEACARYGELKRASPRDFVATFGIGECIRRDDAVVRDARSPSGWRFRGSRAQAIRAYREAFELLPSVHKGFRTDAFARLRELLMTSTSIRVYGRSLTPERTRFRAAPAWAGDSLLLVPFSEDAERRTPDRVVSASSVVAVDQQRAMFRDVAAAWRRAFPDDVLPREAMATALELLGDSTALDTLLATRRLSSDPEQRTRLATQEVWLRVKLALPDDRGGLLAARALADSLLATASTAPAATCGGLAGVAMLTGRVHLAAALSRRSAMVGRSSTTPTRVSTTSAALLAYAAIGGPIDSLRALEGRVVRDVRTMVAAAEQPEKLRDLLARAAGLAFPVAPFASHAALLNNPVLEAQAALARGDLGEARRILYTRRAARAQRRAADLTLDITFPAAWTLDAAGDRAEAVRWLDPVLNAAALYAPEVIRSPANVGALMRAIAFRAELAAAAGDGATARRWARALATLWTGADAPLLPVAQRMEALAAASPASPVPPR